MNFIKSICVVLCSALMLTGCETWNNTAKGGLIGAAGGAALGALVRLIFLFHNPRYSITLKSSLSTLSSISSSLFSPTL